MTKPIRCSLIVWAAFLITPALLVAQQKPLHINPVIAKLAEGKTVYGLNTGDLSLVYAREVARAPVDFVYADMEHNPLDFPALHLFLMGMTDKAMVLKKGNLQPNVALFARFPPEAPGLGLKRQPLIAGGGGRYSGAWGYRFRHTGAILPKPPWMA